MTPVVYSPCVYYLPGSKNTLKTMAAHADVENNSKNNHDPQKNRSLPSGKQLSVVDRYFTCRYRIDNNYKTEEDQCILSHSNRICIITVAPSHPIFKTRIEKVNFQVTSEMNRLENKVTGKSKRGAQWLKPKSPLCIVTCDNGLEYTMYSCMRGQLIEVNENLVQNPNLLIEKPLTEGYIAIVLPVLHDYEREMSKLLSEDEYQAAIQQRKTTTTATATTTPTSPKSEV